MAMINELTLAVAGGGKTQSIIDACAGSNGPLAERTLAVTFTRTGQRELATRLRAAFPSANSPQVMGWFAFLQKHFIRPYLPRLYKGARLRGFNFDGDPGRYAKDRARYLDSSGCAYRRHLAKLTHMVMEAADNAPIDRIERAYTDIFVDEVQDLVGWDLEILDRLLESRTRVHLVGDLRQSLLQTNPHDLKNKQYRGVELLKWFLEREGPKLEIHHQTDTYRCNQQISDFADRIFEENAGFRATVSLQLRETGHDGVVIVKPQDVARYVDRYSPACLRHSSASAKKYRLRFSNFGEVKGLTYDRVLIVPTNPIKEFMVGRKALPNRSACALYVGVTRARYSVAIVLSAADGQRTGLPVWSPMDP